MAVDRLAPVDVLELVLLPLDEIVIGEFPPLRIDLMETLN